MANYSVSEIESLQKISLEMATVFVEFCKLHHLTAYLCGGGCIGGLRHKGFIPWDDDLDFFMPREDYEIFLTKWNTYPLSQRYPLSTQTKQYIDRNIFATIRDSHTTQIKPYQIDLDIPHGVALDIIPLDGYAPTKWKRKFQCIYGLIYSLFCAQVIPENHGGILGAGSRVLLFLFRGKGIRYALWSLAKKRMTRFSISESEFVTELCSGPYYMKKKYPASVFKRAIEVPFEDRCMPIPVGYDTYLKEAFGDYMELPPVEKQVAHHDSIFFDPDNGYENYRGKYFGVEVK